MLDRPVPIFRQLSEIDPSLTLIDLSVFGVVFVYSQMSNGYCHASYKTIGNEVLLNEKTVDRSVKKMVSIGLITDLTPDNRGKAHHYIPSKIATDIIDCSHKVYSLDNQTVVTKSTVDETVVTKSTVDSQTVVTKSDDVVVDDESADDKTFGKSYSRWVETFGDLDAGQRHVFSDYFDDVDYKPEWVLKAVNETIVADPKPKSPFRYFKRIIDGYIKTGGPVERDPAKPPVKSNWNGHKNIDPSTATPQTGVGQVVNGMKIVGRV